MPAVAAGPHAGLEFPFVARGHDRTARLHGALSFETHGRKCDARKYATVRSAMPTTGSRFTCLAREAPQKVRLRHSDKPLKIHDILNANQFARGSLGKRRKAVRDRKCPPWRSLWFARLSQTLLKPKGISALRPGRREFATGSWRRERDWGRTFSGRNGGFLPWSGTATSGPSGRIKAGPFPPGRHRLR